MADLNADQLIAMTAIVASMASSVITIFIREFFSWRKTQKDKSSELFDRQLKFYEYISSLMSRRIYRLRKIYYLCSGRTTLDRDEVMADYSGVTTE